jgi:copper(I)-binding protein
VVEQQKRTGFTRRRVVAVAVAAASLTLTGCAAGQHAQTVNQKPAVDGVTADSGSVGIRYAGVAAPENGKSWDAGANVPLELVIVNNGLKDDTLTGVSSAAASAVIVSGGPIDIPAGSTTPAAIKPLVIPAGRSIEVGLSNTDAGILLQGAKTPLFPSQTVPVTLTFKSGAQIDAMLAVKLTEGSRVDPTLPVRAGENG